MIFGFRVFRVSGLGPWVVRLYGFQGVGMAGFGSLGFVVVFGFRVFRVSGF